MHAKCIAFAHHKGGTGKTTSCINIAGELVKRGKKVLIVDMDPQASATSGLRINKKYLPFSLYDALFDHCHGEGKMRLRDVIISTEIDNLHLAPAELDLAGLLVGMQDGRNVTHILDKALDDVRGLYDYILIDTPPSYTFLLINAIVAADSIVLPLDTGYFSMDSIETFNQILKDIESELGIKKPIETIIVTKFAGPSAPSFLKELASKVPFTARFFTAEDPLTDLEDKLRTYLSVGTKFSGDLFFVPYSKDVYAAQKKGVPVSHSAAETKIKNAYAGITEKLME
jgi:chromosome partitioning protein